MKCQAMTSDGDRCKRNAGTTVSHAFHHTHRVCKQHAHTTEFDPHTCPRGYVSAQLELSFGMDPSVVVYVYCPTCKRIMPLSEFDSHLDS